MPFLIRGGFSERLKNVLDLDLSSGIIMNT